MNMIPNISGATWQEIVKLLGSGDFVRISFRAPETDAEFALGELQGFHRNRGSWWICEAVYHTIQHVDNGVQWSEVTQKVPFRLSEEKS